MAFDFKKEYKEFYLPRCKPEIVHVPRANYIAVRGKGDPNEEGGAYKAAIGVLLALFSLFLLSRSSKREGVNFAHNIWILFVALSAVTGALSGLYDKFIMGQLEPVFVQSWYNLYQLIIMTVVVSLLWWPKRKTTTPFRWSWAIPLISIFLSAADFAYFYALSEADSMISVVSMIRRGSVIISFLCGAVLFHERNLKAKAIDLALILLGMVFLWIGSR